MGPPACRAPLREASLRRDAAVESPCRDGTTMLLHASPLEPRAVPAMTATRRPPIDATPRCARPRRGANGRDASSCDLFPVLRSPRRPSPRRVFRAATKTRSSQHHPAPAGGAARTAAHADEVGAGAKTAAAASRWCGGWRPARAARAGRRRGPSEVDQLEVDLRRRRQRQREVPSTRRGAGSATATRSRSRAIGPPSPTPAGAFTSRDVVWRRRSRCRRPPRCRTRTSPPRSVIPTARRRSRA